MKEIVCGKKNTKKVKIIKGNIFSKHIQNTKEKLFIEENKDARTNYPKNILNKIAKKKILKFD